MSEGKLNRVTPMSVGKDNPAMEMTQTANGLEPSAVTLRQSVTEPPVNAPISNEDLDIYQCSRTGNTDGLKTLLRNEKVRQEINKLDEEGMCALHYAARFNRCTTVEVLVNNGEADVSCRDKEGATALHHAARKRQDIDQEEVSDIITCLVEHKADVNATDNYLSTPLHFAAMRNNERVTTALLTCEDIEIDVKDHLKATPLLDAVTYGSLGVAEMLLERNCDVMVKDSEGCTALHLASMNEGEQEMVNLLLDHVPKERHKEFLNAQDSDGNTALHLAVENRNQEMVELLIQKGVDLNAICRAKSEAFTPLHLAAIAGDRRVAELLLKNGASANIRDKDSTVPLHRAAEYKNVDVVELLLRESKTSLESRDNELYTPLLTACCYDNKEVVESLLEQGANITASEDQDRTALHLAVENNQVEVTRLLIKSVTGKERKRLLNAVDRFGNTALHGAAKNGNAEITKNLLQDNATKHDLKNEEEETPFLVAAVNGHASVCKLLLSKNRGKCINDEDEDSNTALHLAAKNGNLEVVRLLLEKGADKKGRNCTLWTPLDFAASSGHVEIVKALLEEDAPVDPLDKSRTTPLHLASKNGHTDVVTILMEHGAKVYIADKDGHSALDLAVSKGNEDVAKVIVQSNRWREALMHSTMIGNGKSKIRSTPARKMIQNMPEVMKLVLDRCITTGVDDADSSKFWIEFNFELIDDTLSRQNDKGDANAALQDNDYVTENLYDYNGTPHPDALLHLHQMTTVKQNHPLTLMLKYGRVSLLTHPVVLALIRHKWAIASGFYFFFLIFYALFLGFFSAYIIVATPPYELNMNECESGALDNVQTNFEKFAKYIIIAFAAFGIILEGLQLVGTRWSYLKTLVNLLDWFTYVSAVLVVLDITPCGARTDWQWQLSAFCVFIAWMDLLLFLRRLPQVGIYVVMVVEIFTTFAKFFFVFFLFICAFSLSFYVLLRNQSAFRSPFYSLMKTWVMLIGEIEFTTIFHENQDSTAYDDQLFYEESTYGIFVFFLIVMAIIIMNLLTGLAVDDVNELQENARLKKLAMQVNLALDVEVSLPRRIRRWRNSIVQKKKVYPYAKKGWTGEILRALLAIRDGEDLSEQRYISMVLDEIDEDNDKNQKNNQLEHNLKRVIDTNQKKTEKKLQSLEKMLKTLLANRSRS